MDDTDENTNPREENNFCACFQFTGAIIFFFSPALICLFWRETFSLLNHTCGGNVIC